jgi:DNA (cytosine-5)-methyltransferase 1
MALDGDVRWVCDNDTSAATVLHHRHPGAPNLGDITRVDWTRVEPVDVITAGFPCQPHSQAGHRKGTADERWLWDDIARGLAVLRPRAVILENVRGLLSSSGGHAMGRVLRDLSGLGYVGRWGLVAASHVGAPHRRERVFVVAHHADTREPGPQGRAPSAVPGGTWTGEQFAGCGADAATDPHGGPGMRNGRGGADALPGVVTLLPTPAVNDMGAGKSPEQWDMWTDSMRAKHGNGNGHGKSLAIEAQRFDPYRAAADGRDAADALPGVVTLLPTPRVSRSHTRSGERSGELLLNGIAAKGTFGPYQAAIERWSIVMGRPAPPPTEPGTGAAPRLSPRFVEWMMGLPDGWVCDVPGVSRTNQLILLGNGVVPQQAGYAVAVLAGAPEPGKVER